MADLLMILNPRNIEECVESYKRLEIDRAWITGMAEDEAREAVYRLLVTTHYDRYIIISDDCIASQDALDAVLSQLDAGHPVVTGYCNLDVSDARVNLTTAPVAGDPNERDSYRWWTRQQVEQWPDEHVPTFFCGMALTGMSREMWLSYPPTTEPMDWSMSVNLLAAGFSLVAARGAFVWHVKERWGDQDREPRKRLLIGHVPAGVRVETHDGQTRRALST